MQFSTLEDYNDELNNMEKNLKEMEEFIKNHPEKLGYVGNYETYKYVYNILKNDKLEFIEELNRINLKLTNRTMNNGMRISDFSTLGKSFFKAEKASTKLLNSNFSSDELLVHGISKGSYKITFTFQNPTEDDVKRISPRKKGLLKIFNFIKCGDDIERLKKEAGPNGQEALSSYKEFLVEIIKNYTDFTLDTENGTLKADLTLDECKNICENLNI